MFCRDWNGSKRGHVYKFLRSQGFVSSYDTAHHYTDNEVDAHKVRIRTCRFSFRVDINSVIMQVWFSSLLYTVG